MTVGSIRKKTVPIQIRMLVSFIMIFIVSLYKTKNFPVPEKN